MKKISPLIIKLNNNVTIIIIIISLLSRLSLLILNYLKQNFELLFNKKDMMKYLKQQEYVDFFSYGLFAFLHVFHSSNSYVEYSEKQEIQ